MVYYRATFHTFAFWQPPPRVSYCGRDYLRGRTVTALPTRGYSFVQVMRIEPEGWRVYSMNPVDADVSPIAGLPCTMGLVVEVDDDRLVEYGLDGGP